jgi:hypothetical protein
MKRESSLFLYYRFYDFYNETKLNCHAICSLREHVSTEYSWVNGKLENVNFKSNACFSCTWI